MYTSRKSNSSSSFSRKPGSPRPSGSSGSFTRPTRSGGGPRGSAGRSFGGRSQGGYRGNGGRSARGGGRQGERIDYARFVNKVSITEESTAFIPEHKFADFKIDEVLKQAVIKKGYILPTPIQDRTISHILEGRDLVGIANTGTGKTAAFLLPLINKVLQNRKEQVMIIVPTRELAIQIQDELRGFTAGMKMFSVCCVGGAPIGRQISELRYQNNFIIGTPGRLKDLINRKLIRLNEFRSIVLDEADRMLDMGFVNDMRTIMTSMPKERQTLFFSATVSTDIEKLITEFLKEPVRISVKTQDTSKNIEQDVIKVQGGGDKFQILHDLLTQKGLTKVLIFGRTKHGVEKLSKSLSDKGLKAESIHGNKNHSQRQRALKMFKENHIQVLVATDVAARGLDIVDVSHVINYDLPMTYTDYVHRIGRTGRGNKKGKALTFI